MLPGFDVQVRPSAYRKIGIAIAPNGARRTKADHPKLPITPDEIAHAAAAAAEAGAAMIHLHVRDAAGAHALDAARYREAIGAIKSAVGDRMVVQITTEAVGRYRPEAQMDLVRDVRPEAVSLALRELCPDSSFEARFSDFLGFILRERIAPQFILYDPAELARLRSLVDRGVVPQKDPPVLYVLGRYGTQETSRPRDILSFLAEAGDRFARFMVCAFGRQEAACGIAAALLDGDVRVGLENNLCLPDGNIAPDNAALVRAVIEPLVGLGFMPASADDMRARLDGSG